MKDKNIDEMVVVSQKNDGVELQFSKDIPENAVEEQVSSCVASTCSCCTPLFREKVESFSTSKTDAGIKVKITGDITAEQVEENVLGCAPGLAE